MTLSFIERAPVIRHHEALPKTPAEKIGAKVEKIKSGHLEPGKLYDIAEWVEGEYFFNAIIDGKEILVDEEELYDELRNKHGFSNKFSWDRNDIKQEGDTTVQGSIHEDSQTRKSVYVLHHSILPGEDRSKLTLSIRARTLDDDKLLIGHPEKSQLDNKFSQPLSLLRRPI